MKFSCPFLSQRTKEMRTRHTLSALWYNTRVCRQPLSPFRPTLMSEGGREGGGIKLWYQQTKRSRERRAATEKGRRGKRVFGGE